MSVECSQPESATPGTAEPTLRHVHQNIGGIVAFLEREHEKVGAAQRRLEIVSRLIGRPGYLISLLSLVGVWIAANGMAAPLGAVAIDPPPFIWLTGLLTLAALVTATMVRDRHDPEAVALQERTNAARLLSDLESGGVGNDGKPAGNVRP